MTTSNIDAQAVLDAFDTQTLEFGDFKSRVVDEYLGSRGDDIPGDELAARSIIPPMTAKARSFASLSTLLPFITPEKCTACMECVICCPDAAIVAKVNTEAEVEAALAAVPESRRGEYRARFAKIPRYWQNYEKQGKTPGLFSLWIDPDKCKACAECVEVCDSGDHHALRMDEKEGTILTDTRESLAFVLDTLPKTSRAFVNERLHGDLFLSDVDETKVYCGGAGSCMGCGEITAIKMALTATAAKYGKNFAIVAATGCNSVFSSTYPYNIFGVPWTNSLFENAPACAMGVRMRLDQAGKQSTKLWAFGGDGAMLDIGFQSLSRMICSGKDIKVLVLDTQVYSNTGGQASTSTFTGQTAKMSAHGKAAWGKTERRKELGQILMMHPDAYIAQVSPAFYNHFLRATLDALAYPGPAILIAYSTCMPEHGVPDNSGFDRAHAAVHSRAFPLFTYDPRLGPLVKDRIDLRGNPSVAEDWHTDKKSGVLQNFEWFARGEQRFAHLFDKDGKSDEHLATAQAERLENWKRLKELAGQ